MFNKWRDSKSCSFGLLLYRPTLWTIFDLYSSSWKAKLKGSKGFGDLAEKLTGIKNKASWPSPAFLSKYRRKEVEEFEKARKRDRDSKIKKYLAKFSKKGIVRIIPSPGAPGMFDPRKILALSDKDFIYVYYETTDKWGTLKVQDGARIEVADKTSAISLGPVMKVNGGLVVGDGWSIKFKKGWKLSRNKEGYFFPKKVKK